jgi:F-type H+-transporting ATPase subunit gamma
MPSLKDLRTRITSVKSTKRITSAMKMVAAAKLRRAQDQAIAARPYAERMERMLGSLAGGTSGEGGPKLLAGTGSDNVHLLIVMTTDRGLCGGFNGSIMRGVRKLVRDLEADGKTVKLFGVGRKGNAIMRREYPDKLVEALEEIAKPAPTFAGADIIAGKITEMFDSGDFDCCTIVYNKFISALTQDVTPQQLIPFAVPQVADDEESRSGAVASYEYEPDEEEILADLLPRNLSVQVFRAMLETFASEQGSRMTAMDSASRNAGDMIDKLTLTYNRARQAGITKELIEIISGAEAL